MRRSYYTGKYKIPPELYKHTMSYVGMYKTWLKEYNLLTDTMKGVNLDGMPHGTGTGQPTEKLAIRRAELRNRMEKVEESIKEVCPDMYDCLLKAYINNISFDVAKVFLNLPCERTFYYTTRRKFLKILSEKIK